MNVSQTFDVAIIGGGHNGLVCAAYLAAAGLKTVVLEQNEIVGGAAGALIGREVGRGG